MTDWKCWRGGLVASARDVIKAARSPGGLAEGVIRRSELSDGGLRYANPPYLLPRSESQNRVDVGAFYIGIFLEDFFARPAHRQQTQDVCNGYPQIANAGTTIPSR
jgi:hypothetical protein